jgi:PST family polysaccharide transporter
MTRSAPPPPQTTPPGSYGAAAARSSAALTVAKTLRYGLVFAVQAVLMNFLAPDEFGLMKYVTVILGIVNLIATAGLNIAIVQKKELRPEEVGPLFTLNLLVCACLFAIVFACAPLIAAAFGEMELVALIRVGALVIPVGGASAVHTALLQREFKYGTFSLIEAVSAVVSSIVSVALAFNGFGAWALCWSLVAFPACSSCLCLAVRRETALTLKNWAPALPLFWFGSGWALLRLIDYVNANLGNLMMGSFFGPRVLGTFTVASDIISIPRFGLGLTLIPVALSALSRMQGDGERIKNAYLQLAFFTSTVSTVYCVITGFCAADIIKTVTMLRPGGEWDETVVFMRYLAPTSVIYSWSSCQSAVWTATGKIRFQVLFAAAMALSTAAFMFAGSFYGYLGVLAALLIRAAVLFPVIVYAMKKVSGVSVAGYLAALLPSLICGAAAVLSCVALNYLFTARFPVHHVARLAVCAIVPTMVSAAALMLFFGEKVNALKNYIRPAAPPATGKSQRF